MKIKNLKIKTKVLMLLVFFISLSFFTSLYFVVHKTSEIAYKRTISEVYEISRKNAEVVKRKIGRVEDAVSATAKTLEFFKENNFSREDTLRFLTDIVNKTENIYALWVSYQPNMFDMKDEKYKNKSWYDSVGIFNPYISKTQRIKSFDEFYSKEKNFIHSFITNKPFITKIYEKEIVGTKRLFFSVCFPIREKGKAIGVIGAEIEISIFEEMSQEIKPLKTGYIIIATETGKIIGHPQAKIIGTNTNKYFSEIDIAGNISKGKNFYFSKESTKFVGEFSYYIFSPIEFNENTYKWSFCSVIKNTDIFGDVQKIKKIGLIINAIATIFIFSLIFIIT